ncbi:MAG: hypothetical protein H8E44_24835 [Planctomycetes bacterium]|nr:hypothetical protein [Planctomycetota bacterium]MBL7037485.1 hypothetical protein [Pirellulaceae bacterium]
MKQTLAVIPRLLCACILLVPANVSGDETETNLVANPSFEESKDDSTLPDAWNGDRSVYSRDAEAGRDGSASLKYVNDDPGRYRLAMQRIPLKPGRKYRFRGWIRTDRIVGEESGATLCIEWSDKAGKWMGGVYPSGVKGTRPWTQVGGVTRVPEDAGSCSLSCYVRRGMTGTAWFDDVEVFRIVDPPLRSVLTSPVYRGRITASEPKAIRAVVRIDLRDYDLQPADLSVRGVLSDCADGKVHGVAEKQPIAHDGIVEPVVLEIPAEKLPPGKYRWESGLVDAGGETIYSVHHELVRVPNDSQPTCAIDGHRRLLMDGKPFFPLGVYWSSINEDDLRIYAESKFNCLMPYGSPSRQQMDLAERYGMKVIYSIKDWYAGSRWCPSSIRTVDDEERMVRTRVREYRDHPALLAWYLNDELPQDFLPQLAAHQRWVEEEDPNHPTWVVLYQVNQVAAYIETFDVIGTDPYPIGRKPASMAAEWTAETFRQVERARPMWQVPQLHNWANYAKSDGERSKGRTPTCDEIRSMAWQCIAEGATGLVFYSWFDVKRNPDVSFEEQWSGLKRMAAEIDRMAPILLSIESVPEVRVNEGGPPAWLHWFVRRHLGKLYVIAVNDGDGEGNATFHFFVPIDSVRELTQARAIEPNARSFDDRLDRLSVGIYEVVEK